MGSQSASRFEDGHWTGAGGDDSLVVLAAANSGTRNLTTDPYQKVTVGGTPVLAVPALLCGAKVVLQVIQGSGGTHIPTWTGVKWAGGAAPTLSTPAAAVDRILFESDGVDVWGFLLGKAFA